MVEEKFVPLGDAKITPADLDKLKQLREGREGIGEGNLPRSVGAAAARDFVEKKPPKRKKAPVETGEGEYVVKKAEKREVKEEADLANDIKNINTREELLSYLATMDAVKTAPWKNGKKSGRGRTYPSSDFVAKVTNVFNNPNDVPPASLEISALEKKVKEILALERKVRKAAEKKRESRVGKAKEGPETMDQLFDALGISEKSFADEPASGEAVSDSVGSEGQQETTDPSAAESVTPKPETEKVIAPREVKKSEPEEKKAEKFPAPEKPKKAPEDKAGRAQERQRELTHLKMEVDQTRKEYAEMDYKKKKAWNRLKSFMPSLFKDQREEDQDVAYYRAQYDNKLFQYKNLLLEDAKEKGVSNKELGDIVKFFATEANLNMADAHTDAKVENHEGRVSGKLKDFSLKMIESYRKLPTAKKLAIGAGFLGVGALTGAAGIGVGAFAAATASRRFFMGAVTGTSVALGLEARSRGKTEQLVDKGSKVFSETAEKLDEEKKYEAAQRVIDQLIYDEDQKINKIKNKNLRNLALGVGVGTLVGSASHWLGMLNDKLEAYRLEEFQKAKDYLSGRSGISPPGAGVAEGVHDTGVSGAGVHAEAPVGPALEKPVNLKIQSGSSLEGTIIKNLKGAGMSADEAGTKAHLMALKFAKEKGMPFEKLNETYPGQELELSPDGTKIVGISGMDDPVDSLEKDFASANVPEAEIKAEDMSLESTEDGGNLLTESAPETEIHHGVEVPEEGTGEYLMDAKTSAGITEMEATLNQVNGQLGELDGKILKIASGQYEGEDLWPSPDAKLDELRMQKQMLEQTKETLIARIYSGHIGSLRKLIYGGIAENIDKVGKMPAAELLDNKNSLGYKFFARVMDSHSPNVIELQRHISPLKGERVEEWIMRIGKIMKKSGIRKI